MLSSEQPIGIFDSGIGGLSVMEQIKKTLPHENLLYFADSIHLPYGDRSIDEIYQFSLAIVDFLIHQPCKLIVIACNTASAAALHPLRNIYPNISFVGMEPAVKPAAEQSQTGKVGVIATVATFQGALFKSVMERFATGVEVIAQPCPGLVQQIEAGKLDTPDTETMLRGWIEPMLDKGIDRLVLGCTHYPFVTNTIIKIVGTQVEIIDPAPAVARQIYRLLERDQLLNQQQHQPFYQLLTSGEIGEFKRMMKVLEIVEGNVEKVLWENNKIIKS